jgi:hypothetical protein
MGDLNGLNRNFIEDDVYSNYDNWDDAIAGKDLS